MVYLGGAVLAGIMKVHLSISLSLYLSDTHTHTFTHMKADELHGFVAT